MSRYRTGLAFIITPLISPLVVLVSYGLHMGALPDGRAIIGAFIYYGLLAYIITALFGIPAFLLLRSSESAGKPLAAGCGGILGFAVAVILFGMVEGVPRDALIEGYMTYAITGAVSGLVFWIIATRWKAKSKSNDSAPDDEI